jgi:hypothetical protein
MTNRTDETSSGPEPDDGADVGTLARRKTEEVIDALAAWVKSSNDRASLAAASILLERGWGKVDARADPIGAPITVIRAPTVAEDSEAWEQQYAPPAVR